MDSKKYNNTKLAISIFEGVLSFIVISLFVFSGFSNSLNKSLLDHYGIINDYLRFLVFLSIAGAGGIIFSLPISYYSDYYLEHKYNLSNQTFLFWVWEKAKGFAISLIIGIPILLIFLFTIKTFMGYWWFVLSIVIFFFSVILSIILPVVVLPLFYKITPYENENLNERIKKLALSAGLKISNIYKFNMSKNTKKANAAFTGLGKTKRIILGDTLIDNFSDDEVETVIAHELGHYKKKHLLLNIIIGTVNSFLTLFIISLAYGSLVKALNFNSISDIGSLPLILLCGMLIGLFQTPISNFISRKFEYQADKYAIEVTKNKNAFVSALKKLAEQNLADSNPNPFVEWFFYSHPSIKKRIRLLNK